MITDQQKTDLFKHLEECGIVETACRKSGISRASYYRLRNENPEFRRRLDRALKFGRLLICDMAESKLINLVKQEHFFAIQFLLRHNHPRYTNKEIPEDDSELSLEEIERKMISNARNIVGLLLDLQRDKSLSTAQKIAKAIQISDLVQREEPSEESNSSEPEHS